MTLPSSGPISISQIATEFGGGTPHSLSEYYRGGAYTTSNNTNVPTSGTISLSQFYGAYVDVRGHAVYAGTSTTDASGSFVVPANVNSVCILCIGSGAGAVARSGGGGGALAYANNVSTTPSESLTYFASKRFYWNALDTQSPNSYVKRSTTSLCEAGGGYTRATTTTASNNRGVAVVGTGGNGGLGGNAGSGQGGGGGGAGGYASGASGQGGRGLGNNSDNHDGAGGAGGGGWGSSSRDGAGGGGVGIYGQGSSGLGATAVNIGGGGGSGGETGPTSGPTGSRGGDYGGGAGGNDNNDGTNIQGGAGCVRILWGYNRAFPSTNVSSATN